MERTGTVIIARSDFVILGGSEAALQQAYLWSEKGTVLMIVEGTRLGADRGDLAGYDTPDQYYRALEEKCSRLGIKVLYFLKYVDSRRIGEKYMVRVAAKGGLYGVICREWADFRDNPDAQEAGKGALHKQMNGMSRLYIQASGQNRFGRYEFLEQSEEEAWVEAKPEYFDLVIAGGGTAGAMAAIHAARGGLRTVLIEPNQELGGTQTVGGVSTYWFGHRFRDVREIDERTAQLYDKGKAHRRRGIWSERDDFDPGLRADVYLEFARDAGVKVVFGQLAYQALCARKEADDPGRPEEGSADAAAGVEVIGFLTAGDAGNRIYFGKAFIDATGDGDLAVSAGAAHCYGSETDLITYWGSLAQYTSPDTYKNNFSSMLFAEDPLDYSRFIRLGRKRGGAIYDHGRYVSMRESRHIRGEKTVTLHDLITYRIWEDGLYTCYSNYDPKGKLDADMVYCGVLPPQVSIQIPLGALLPVDERGRRIANLYVAGKAISATHNVFPSIRMQPDLMHQGAVLGALLAYAMQQGERPETLDARRRREFLLSYADDPLTLPEFQMSAQECAAVITQKDRTHWVDVPFVFEEKGTYASLGLMAGVETDEREAVKAVLRKRLEHEMNPQERQMLIGYALWYGMDDWTEELCSAICEKLEKYGLSERKGSVMCAQLLPDHGVMPEVVYQLNQLAFSKKTAVQRPFEVLLALLQREERDYLRIQQGMFHYIEAFGYVAEHSPQPGFAPMIKELLRFPELQGCVTERESTDLMTERFQILTFLLNRALFSLGDEDGVKGLQKMLRIENMAIRGSILMTLERMGDKNRREGKVW